MAVTVTRGHLSRVSSVYWITSGNDFVMGIANGSLSDAATMLEFCQLEPPAEYGYSRQSFMPGSGTYNSGKSRQELTVVGANFTAGTIGIDYNKTAILIEASTISNRLVTTIDASTDKLFFATGTALGLAANDKVVVTADAGGTVPAALLNSGNPQILYVRNPIDTSGERSIQLALTSGGTPINFTGGSGPIRVRWANGEIELFDSVASSTIPPGVTRPIFFGINYGGNSADVNAA